LMAAGTSSAVMVTSECVAATTNPSPVPSSTAAASTSASDVAMDSAASPADATTSPSAISSRESMWPRRRETTAEALIDPAATAVSTKPAVPSPTPVSSAMNGSAGPNEVTQSPQQNSPRNALACARATSRGVRVGAMLRIVEGGRGEREGCGARSNVGRIRESIHTERYVMASKKATEDEEDQIDDDLGDESEEIIPFMYSITSYGADYPVDGLVKRVQEKSIFVPPFQRGFVWSLRRASLFVESLLLGLPVPGIFLSREQDSQKLLVIDGQQRLSTLDFFYRGTFEDDAPFALKGVPSSFEGSTYQSLSEDDRWRLDNSIIHATIVKQDEPSEDDSSIYHVFERLNTGGLLLQPQEIRGAIYHGPFNELLKQLNETAAWREIYGNVSSRMRDRELILRFLALLFRSDHYKEPMKEFLNKYMGRNRAFAHESEDEQRSAFVRSIELIRKCVGTKAFKPKRALNAAVFDSVMVGISKRLHDGPVKDEAVVVERYEQLLKSRRFRAATDKATAAEEKVSRRLRLAVDAFADIA
jgi:hypothetical protein